MHFVVDENLPAEVADQLSSAGHDAITVFDRLLSGKPDHRVAELCKAEERALLTLDVDFANTLLYPPTEYFGLVVLRLASQDKPHVLAVTAELIPKLNADDLVGKLWVVDEERIRIR